MLGSFDLKNAILPFMLLARSAFNVVCHCTLNKNQVLFVWYWPPWNTHCDTMPTAVNLQYLMDWPETTYQFFRNWALHGECQNASPIINIDSGNTWLSSGTTLLSEPIGLLPKTQNCGLRIRRECRERFPRHRLQRKLLVSDRGMHHGRCLTHVPWCMSGSLTRGGGENVPSIPGACTTCYFKYLVRGQCWPRSMTKYGVSRHQWIKCITRETSWGPDRRNWLF